MYQKPLLDVILSCLEEAICKQELENSIKLEMLPALAQALEPVIGQYVAKKESFPDSKTFRAIVNNFNQDGPRVRVLVKTRYADPDGHWQTLREQLERNARRRWPNIGSFYQEEIADRAWIRIHRYLPGFLFVSRFSTWGTTILLNEYLRLKPKIEKDKQKRSLDQADEKGRTLGDLLPSPTLGPQAEVERKQDLQQLRERIEELGQALDLKILLLHIKGYKLEEIKRELTREMASAPAVSTIWKRKKRIMLRIKEDEVIRKIAQRLGILPAEND